DLLDDLDLLVAGPREDHVELGLLLGLLGRRRAAAAGRHRRHGHGCRRLDLEGLLELLHELVQLEERHVLELIQQLVGRHLLRGHRYAPSSSDPSTCSVLASVGPSAGAAAAGSASPAESVSPSTSAAGSASGAAPASACGADSGAAASGCSSLSPLAAASPGSFSAYACSSARNLLCDALNA